MAGFRCIRGGPSYRPENLDPFLPVAEENLACGWKVYRNQCHTAKRTFERLSYEHNYDGGEAIIEDAVRAFKLQSRKVFLPLSHRPGAAHVGCGFPDVNLASNQVESKLIRSGIPFDAVFA